VQCENVLIDSCVAIGASDAGIYVGQSKFIEVKNSKAYHNVAGRKTPSVFLLISLNIEKA
jgi:hypothetical protein